MSTEMECQPVDVRLSGRPQHILNKSCDQDIPALVNQISETGVSGFTGRSTEAESDRGKASSDTEYKTTIENTFCSNGRTEFSRRPRCNFTTLLHKHLAGSVTTTVATQIHLPVMASTAASGHTVGAVSLRERLQMSQGQSRDTPACTATPTVRSYSRTVAVVITIRVVISGEHGPKTMPRSFPISFQNSVAVFIF